MDFKAWRVVWDSLRAHAVDKTALSCSSWQLGLDGSLGLELCGIKDF
jgi:hypothetical protein